MKQFIITSVILLSLALITSCNRQDKMQLAQVDQTITSSSYNTFKPDQIAIGSFFEYPPSNQRQIAEYVRKIFEDSRGNLWFGTGTLGVCRFDGDTLVYFSTDEGLIGRQITGILEDQRGNMWFSTTGGISMYDGKQFTNFTEKDGLSSNSVWSIYEDKTGIIWAGTIKGLCRYNPEEAKFNPFNLPQADVSNPKPRFSTKLVRAIMEDKGGNLWFGTDGVGVIKYDPSAEETGAEQFTHITMNDGLCDNNILSMIEDREGNIWFGSRFGGLSRYNPTAGKGFTNFTVEGGDMGNNEVVTVYEDRSGNIWFSSEGYGMYRLKNSQLSNVGKAVGMPIRAVQSIFEDKKGRLWIGGGDGLYFSDGKGFMQFTRDGFSEGC